MQPYKQTSNKFVRTITNILNKIFYFEPNLLAIPQEKKHRWQSVLCFVGLDYFSTLAFQPAIALLAAGMLAPFASLLLIIVTLFCALPTYLAVAKRSFAGQGSIAMLEKLLSGWTGKFVLLGLIAFALTDATLTITISASDAATHIVENPQIASFFSDHPDVWRLGMALFLILLLGFVFYIGIREAIVIAMIVTIPFLFLTFVIIGRGLYEIYLHPEYFLTWSHDPIFKISNVSFILLVVIAFPKLALGLGGFETSIATMPYIRNKNDSESIPTSRIRDTRKMLITSAMIMSFGLLAASLIATIFISQAQVSAGGVAEGRALSYLAHKFLGNIFGNIYDISTIVILWFAGGSAMAGTLALVPRYLPRFGMAPRWVELRQPVVVLMTSICLIAVIIFRADVNAQAAVYATGVLALILSASVAVTLTFRKESRKSPSPLLRFKFFYFCGVSLIFAYTLFDNIHARPGGLILACLFFTLILISSAINRFERSSEMRIEKITFVNENSEKLFNSIQNHTVDLVPVSRKELKHLDLKEDKIGFYRKRENPLAFINVNLRDDRSDFISPLKVSIQMVQVRGRMNYVIQVSGAVAISNTVAYMSEQLHPKSILLELSRKNTMQQALSYVLFGEGEIGLTTYKVLVQYWEKFMELPHPRPTILLISD